ncbi:hypothetical protein SLE2022_108950 [Rubroshorea leprosula]|uniref:Uncharacterized protein n=1 Tax=Rubroshorea leprosula TaxID=152421 RepID=A0AAV5KV92_9ROSI|nr:hypothetical protein SLEP1_g37512 [Rubroshorea leprosula]
MKSLSSVGLGLSIVFGCLLLALVAELYYLLWWKKKFVSRDIENDYSNPAREFFCMFCWKRASSSLSHKALNPQDIRIRDSLVQETEHSNRNLLLKPLGDDSLETELAGLHPLPGPPRFLFTIIEETKEDLESEDGKTRKASRGRSLSDILLTVETPFLTPFTSPPFFTPPLTPLSMESSYSQSHTHQQGFNPLFESVTDAEFNRIRSSPPPKFKFLQDAEEKLYRRKLMEETEKNDGLVQENGSRSSCSSFLNDEEDGSFITIIVDRNSERGFLHQNHHQHPQFHSSTSQVLPLSSSPSKFQPSVTNKLK